MQVGANGYLDASQNVKILEIPTGQITRAMGDVHPQGNPHYWLDPANGRQIAQAIRDKSRRSRRPTRRPSTQRFTDFGKRLAAAEKRWDATMAPLKGRKLVTYHDSWPNFMQRFGLNVMGYVEPKPGIPPPPQHIIDAHRRDESPGRQGHRRRTVLRQEDAAIDRQSGRRRGDRTGAVGRRGEGDHRLHQAVRLQRREARGGAEDGERRC